MKMLKRILFVNAFLVLSLSSYAQMMGGLMIPTSQLVSQYPIGSIFCIVGPTVIIEVINPLTGKTWMDRNLGASQVATSPTDAAAYGDLYQWGRRSDGHQCRISATTTTLSSTDTPMHSDFIIFPSSPSDWRNPPNDNLWQGVNGINNPCPIGFRVPTDIDLFNEYQSWSPSYAAGAFASPLKFTLNGMRLDTDGLIQNVGLSGYYWSSTVSLQGSRILMFNNISNSVMSFYRRSLGSAVRCIKN